MWRKQGKIVNLIAFSLGGEGSRGPDRGRMRGRFTVVACKRVIAARLALISQRTGPLTASVSVPSAAYGGCAPTRACGRSPAGEAFLFSFPRRPKPACTACGVGQFIGGGERCLPDRGNAELGDALAGLDGVGPLDRFTIGTRSSPR